MMTTTTTAIGDIERFWSQVAELPAVGAAPPST
jgi:hypothetical protein